MKINGPRAAFLPALFLAASVAGLAPTPVEAACTLSPQLSSFTINQGLGSYSTLTNLVRGKDTVVRLYLSMPSCAASGDSMSLTGATLTVNNVATSFTVNPVSALVGPSYPTIAPYGSAPAINATGDPVFLIPGVDLAPATTTAAFTLSFSASISFSATLGNKSTSVIGTSPAALSGISSANVDKKSNALRVLVVAMGDTSQTYSSQFSSSAQSAIQDGMVQVSRTYPVPSGTGDLTSTTGGLRYTIVAPTANPNELNLGPVGLNLMSGLTMTTSAKYSGSTAPSSIQLAAPIPITLSAGALIRISNGTQSQTWTVASPGALAGSVSAIPIVSGGQTFNATYPIGSTVRWVFCGTSGNFPLVQGQLANLLTAWNSANSKTPADRVVGVIDEAISAGATSGCAEGFAAVGGPQAWARAIYSSSPSITGGVLGMELAHTFGLVPTTRSDPNSPYHSPNSTADASPTQPLYRTYNTATETYINDDHSVMRYVGTYSGANTLLEEPDYACLHYFLGGTAPTGLSCGTNTGTAGTSVGVAAPPIFVMSGTTDGLGPCVQPTVTVSFCEAAGTRLETYFSGGALPTTPPANSTYHLQFIDGSGGLLQDLPVSVAFTDSVHDQVTGVTVKSAGSGVMQLAYIYPTTTARVQFLNGGTLLYGVSNNGPLAAPTLTSTGGATNSLTNYTNLPAAGNIEPAVSPDGKWVAWVPQFAVSPNIEVAPVGNAGAGVQLSSTSYATSAEPAWSSDGKSLAYVDPSNNELFKVTVDTSSGSPIFGTPFFLGEFNSAPHHPSWSPDGLTIAYERDHNIYSVLASGSAPTPLTSGGRESSPSWSPDLGGGSSRIAYSEQANSCVLPGSISEYQLSGNAGPYGITGGPDGNLWFTEGIASKIGFMTTSGTLNGEIATSRTSPTSQPTGITTGPDGNLWVTENTGPNIARITPVGVLTEFGAGVTGDPLRITPGPDGNMWFTEYNNYSIGTISPSTGAVTETHVPTASSHPVGIVTGPDGNLWFTEESANQIGRITPGGTFSEFALTSGSTPESITVGPDGNLWFTENGTNKIGIMNTSGSLVKEVTVTTPGSNLQDLITGPDRNVWFTEFSAGQIGETDGTTVNEYPLPNTKNGPFGIGVGSDGNIWFTEDFVSKIGRITVASCPTSIYSIDPTSPSTASLIVSNASQPSWASRTQLAFSRPSGSSSSVWTGNLDGSNQQQLTTAPSGLLDAWPSAQAAGVVAFARQTTTFACVEFCPISSDIMLLKTAQTVSVSAAIPTNDAASQIRLDVFYQCGGVNYPASIDNPAQSSANGVAQFTFRYDPSLACPGGSLYAVSNDGFSQSTQSSTVPIASDPKPPVPTVDSPLTQPATCTPSYAPCHFLQYSGIALRGTAKDAKDGQLSGNALQWTIGSLNLAPGQPMSGESIDLSPPSGGWTPGTYTVTVTAKDSSGLTSQTQTTIVIDADANNDGLPPGVITCSSVSDTGPSAAFQDFTGDGISTIDSLYIGNGPCSPATFYRGLAVSFPSKIYLGSTSSIFAAGLAVPYANLHQVTPSSVKIVAVAGQATSFANTGWAVVNATLPGLSHVSTLAGVTFNLQTLIQYLKSQPQLVNQTVTFTITGSGSYVNSAGATVGWSFQVTTMATVLPGPPPSS